MKAHIHADSVFLRLQRWYLEQCNGDWEHSYGIRIDTLDNPGWILTIDIRETERQGLILERHIVRRSDDDWIQTEVTDNKFIGCCGPENLIELVGSFLTLVADK